MAENLPRDVLGLIFWWALQATAERCPCCNKVLNKLIRNDQMRNMMQVCWSWRRGWTQMILNRVFAQSTELCFTPKECFIEWFEDYLRTSRNYKSAASPLLYVQDYVNLS